MTDTSPITDADREAFLALPIEAQRQKLIELIAGRDIAGMIAHSLSSPTLHRELISWLGNPRSGTPLDNALFSVFDIANNNAIEAVVDGLEVESGQRVLEIGFGGGRGLSQVVDRGAAVWGVEYSLAMVEKASAGLVKDAVDSGKANLQQGSAEALPLEDAFFDRCFHVNCFYFWTDLDRGLAECLRVLKPGGVMVTGSKTGAAELVLGRNGEFDLDNVFKNTDLDVYLAALDGAGFVDVEAEEREGLPGQPLTDFTLIRSRRP